jgi:hypothetical protein
MADYTLPARRRNQSTPAPTLPVLTLPGMGQRSQAGVEGFLTQLPAQMGSGTPAYQAGIDQSRGGEAAQAAGGMVENMTALRNAQEQSLAAHKAYREGLQRTQQQVDTRNNDLRLAQNLLIATDPNADKAVRKFMLQGLSNAVGVDPKGKYSQDLQKMIMGMSPEALEALRGTFANDITNADPGVIQKQLGALFSGDIPIENVIGQVKQHQEAKAAAASALTSPGLPLTSGAPAGGVAASSVDPATAAAGEAAGAGPAPRVDPTKRQQVIEAAGLVPAPPGTPPAAEAPPVPPTPPDVGPAPQAEPVSPPISSEPFLPGDTGATPPPASPTPTPPVGAPPAVEPAAAAAGQAAGAGPPTVTPTPQEASQQQPPTAATPPSTSKLEIPDSLRQAAEQSGDKLLLDAIKKIDQRNAVLDSDNIHRQGSGEAAGAPPPPPGGAPPTGGGAITKGLSDGLKSVIDALPNDPITGIKPSESKGPGERLSEVGDYIGNVASSLYESAKRMGARLPEDIRDAVAVITTGKNPFAETLDKAITEANKLEEKAAGIQPIYGPAAELSHPEKLPEPLATTQVVSKRILGQSPTEIHNDQITTLNAQRRESPLPKDAVLEYKTKEERPPMEQEVTAKGLLPGLDPSPKVRYTVGDVVEKYTKYREDPAYIKELETRDSKRTQAYNGLVSSTSELARIIGMEGGEQAMGGFNVAGYDVNPGTIAQVREKLAAAFGIGREHQDILNPVIQQKLNEYKTAHPELNPQQLAIQSARLEAALTRYSYEQARALDPQGRLSDKDVQFSAKTTSNLNMSGPMAMAVLNDSLRVGLQRADTQLIEWLGPKGGNLPFDYQNNMSPSDRSNVLQIHAALANKGTSPFDVNMIKEIGGAQAAEAAGKSGTPSIQGENKYLIPRGGNRPEDYDKKLTEKKTLEREGHEQTQKLQLEREQREKEKWAEDQRRHAAQEARQAMLDARHAQEKMAAAFQHIGAMIAGSVKAASVGGGSGISAGGEDSSVFRLAPIPQRAAPRVGGATPPTRYGGPIKRQQ